MKTLELNQMEVVTGGDHANGACASAVLGGVGTVLSLAVILTVGVVAGPVGWFTIGALIFSGASLGIGSMGDPCSDV